MKTKYLIFLWNLAMLAFLVWLTLLLVKTCHAKDIEIVVTIQSSKKTQTIKQDSQYPLDASNWEDMKLIVAKEARKYGIPPSVAIAMTALESGHGTSEFCQKRNNCWGIGAYDSDVNQAFYFPSFQAGTDAFLRLLLTPRYKKAYAVRNNPVEMVKEIKKAGYASSPTYVQKITSLPEFYDYQYNLISSK